MVIDSLGSLLGVIRGKFSRYSPNQKKWIVGFDFPGIDFKMAVGNNLIVVSADTFGIFKSSDGGNTWEQDSIRGKKLTSIGVSGNTIYAGGPQTFYRSTDGGATWEEPVFPFIIGSGVVRAIGCRDSIVIVGVDRTGVYFSSDKGQTWENHSIGLALDTINQVLLTASGALIVATTSGVYYYDLPMQTWKNVNDGLIFGNVLALALGTDGRVYAGTDGDGVYRSTKTYGSWFNSVPRDEYQPDDISIYPNPASTEITINYFKTGAPEKFKVVVYSLLGEALIVENNQINLGVSSLHTGQYFLRIFTDDKIQTLPLSIIK
jgi:hypothetical protein